MFRTNFLFILILIMGISKTSIAQQTAARSTDTSAFSIEDCINTLNSATIVNEKSGWHYFFTDKEKQDGWSIKMSCVNPGTYRHAAHKHAGDEIIFILEGKAEITIEGQSRVVGPNTSIYFPKGTLHGLKNAGSIALKYLVIKKDG